MLLISLLLQSIKYACCRQQLPSLSSLTVFWEEIRCIYLTRKGSWLGNVPPWCYSELPPRNTWVKVAINKGYSCIGLTLPAWQLSNNLDKTAVWCRCKLSGCLRAQVALCHSTISNIGIPCMGLCNWFVAWRRGAEELNYNCTSLL